MELSDWKHTTLGEIITLQRGYDLPSRERKPGKIPIITSSGLAGTHKEARAKGPGVVTGRYGTIGEVFFINEDYWPHNTTLYVRDFKGNDPLFVSYLLKTIDLQSFSGKSGVPGVNRNDLHEISLEVPDPLEQRAIAAALSDVDALLAALDALIAKKRAIKQGAMQELLTGRTRLPGFSITHEYNQTEIGIIPNDWDIDIVGNHASIKTGTKNTQDKVDDGKYPFFVRSMKIEKINSYSFDGEAVLTAGDGVGTGKVFHYINGKFDLHQRVYQISNFSGGLDGYFFYLYFCTHFYDRIMSMTAKSSVDSVRMEMIANMKIPLPSRSEQHAIAITLSEVDAEISALEQQRDKTRLLKLGMMQELLTGRTRLNHD
jgi:type I restriction enzyme, S subunit